MQAALIVLCSGNQKLIKTLSAQHALILAIWQSVTIPAVGALRTAEVMAVKRAHLCHVIQADVYGADMQRVLNDVPAGSATL